jgi:UPF0716 family protein affecting phage T7 exclusion
MRAFLFLFLLFPIIELALLIQVGSAIGVLPTLLLVIGTAILGGVPALPRPGERVKSFPEVSCPSRKCLRAC